MRAGKIVICPFCDERISSRENVVKCRNCGEAFEMQDCSEDFEADEQDLRQNFK